MRSKTQPTLFDNVRITFDECSQMTLDSLQRIEGMYKTWIITWSGGKDSTAMLTFICTAIATGQVKAPDNFKVFIADTRQELVPLWVNAMLIVDKLKALGIDVEVVTGDIDDRFWVYMLGYGVPPPSNTFRWCTPKLKIEPIESRMTEYVRQLNGGKPEAEWGKVLLMTGVRIGESAARDARIAMSCSKDGSECGQGHYHHISKTWLDRLAPIIHWRVCVVWDWLRLAPSKRFGEWPTALLADAYGGDEAEESAARTGCIGCPLASKDKALEAIVKIPHWRYLLPMMEIKALHRWLKLPAQRLRKTTYEVRKDGKGSSNQGRMGPLTMEARMEGLVKLLDIQSRVNMDAFALDRPVIDVINQEEIDKIRWHWTNNSWPQKWTGNEQRADKPFIQYFPDGSSQPDLFSERVKDAHQDNTIELS